MTRDLLTTYGLTLFWLLVGVLLLILRRERRRSQERKEAAAREMVEWIAAEKRRGADGDEAFADRLEQKQRDIEASDKPKDA